MALANACEGALRTVPSVIPQEPFKPEKAMEALSRPLQRSIFL